MEKLKSLTSNLPAFYFALFILSLLFAANGFAQPKPKPTFTKAPVQRSFVMCDIIPGAEVATKTPFTIPFKNAQAWPTAGSKTGCRYIFKSDDEEAGVSIGLTDLGSSKML